VLYLAAAAAAARLACACLGANCSGARPGLAHCLQHLLLCQLFSCLSLPHRCQHCSLCLHNIHAFIPQLLPLILYMLIGAVLRAPRPAAVSAKTEGRFLRQCLRQCLGGKREGQTERGEHPDRSLHCFKIYTF
jgi:hypothetical protein